MATSGDGFGDASVETNLGYQDFLTRAVAIQHHDGWRAYIGDEGTISRHEDSGLIRVHGAGPDQSTAWFADILEAGRPGAARQWGN